VARAPCHRGTAGLAAVSCQAPGWMGGRPGMHWPPAPAVSNVGATARPWREGAAIGGALPPAAIGAGPRDGHAKHTRRARSPPAPAAPTPMLSRAPHTRADPLAAARISSETWTSRQGRDSMTTTPHELHRLAAFTDDPRGGNPAGVWIGDALPPADRMQRIAAEVGYSETAFLAPAVGDVREVRYFSPLAEVPFCGH